MKSNTQVLDRFPMAVNEQPFHGLAGLQVWWPEHADDVVALLDSAAVVSVLHCGAGVAASLRPYAFTHDSHQNLLIDLTQPEPDLWRNIRRRDRLDIRNAAKLNYRVRLNEETEQAFTLVDGFIRRRRFRPPMHEPEWRELQGRCDVFLVECAGVAIASRVVLVDAPGRRVRGLFGATVDRGDSRYRGLVGPLNRMLFWHEFIHYKARGMCWYDMGGVEFDRASPIYTISQFKASFGGVTANEHSLRLAGQPFVRSLFRAAAAARRMWWRPDAVNL